MGRKEVFEDHWVSISNLVEIVLFLVTLYILCVFLLSVSTTTRYTHNYGSQALRVLGIRSCMHAMRFSFRMVCTLHCAKIFNKCYLCTPSWSSTRLVAHLFSSALWRSVIMKLRSTRFAIAHTRVSLLPLNGKWAPFLPSARMHSYRKKLPMLLKRLYGIIKGY